MVMDAPQRRTLTEDQRRDRNRARRIEKAAKRPKPNRADEERLRNRILWITCCDWWATLAFYEALAQGISAKSKAVASVLAEYEIYPPPADTTPMQPCWCPSCQGVRMWPAHYVTARGISVECGWEMDPAAASAMPSSPGVVNMARLKGNMRRGLSYWEE